MLAVLARMSDVRFVRMEESANAAIVVETIWATFSSPSSCEISEARMWKNGCVIFFLVLKDRKYMQHETR